MAEQTTSKNAAKKLDMEALLAVFLIFFIIFTIIWTLATVIGTFSTDSNADGTEESTDGIEENEPPVPNPVFVGTAIPPLSSDSASTITGISSKYATLVNVETGKIIATKQGDVRFAPASMTKVMTLIVACEYLSVEDLDRKLEYTMEVYEYTSMGAYDGTEQMLSGGEKNYQRYLGDFFKIRDLLYGIGVASSSECTYMICKEIGGTEEGFVALMNQKAERMGLFDTHFDNAIGHESENNYTTANDMATIMMYAMQSDLICDILKKRDIYRYEAYYNEDGVEKSYNRQFNATLQERYDTYKEVFASSFFMKTATLQGGKTGYLKENGVINNCLVSWATSDNDGTLYVLVLGCNDKNSAYTMKDVKATFEAHVD